MKVGYYYNNREATRLISFRGSGPFLRYSGAYMEDQWILDLSKGRFRFRNH